MSQPQQPNPSDVLKKNGYAAAMIIPLSLVMFIYERALVPLYGSGPTRYMLTPTVMLAAALAALDPVAVPISWNWLLLGLSLSLAPNANYWVAVWTGRYGKPLAGAATTHATVLFPLVFLMFTAATNGVFHQVSDVLLNSVPHPLTLNRLRLLLQLQRPLSHRAPSWRNGQYKSPLSISWRQACLKIYSPPWPYSILCPRAMSYVLPP